jgi:signal transduction histidine kinase
LFSRHLYLRIWLAALAGIVVVVLTAGWAWQVAEERRMQPIPRDVTMRDAFGNLIGSGQALRTSPPGDRLAFTITLSEGERILMEIGARDDRWPDLPPWLEPRTGIFWVLGIAGLATAIGLFPAVRLLTKRLQVLRQTVQRFGQGGDLTVRACAEGNDEVAELARHINAAGDRIEHLMDAQVALLQSQKSMFANASHELRSPLARIRMSLELSQHHVPPATRDEISRNIAELDLLAEEILLSSRLDARSTNLGVVERVDLIGLLAEECVGAGATLELSPGITQVEVNGIAKLLRRAVRNLLENAVRHGARTGRSNEVSAELGIEENWAVLRVNDRGPGVPPELRERIFETFFRLPGASEQEGSVGLGLSLVKSIAKRHEGSVSCDNRPGGGACFTLRLPLA